MITRDHIEKAFSEGVSYLLCTFKEDDRTGMREPTKGEVKDRLLALVGQTPEPRAVGHPVDNPSVERSNNEDNT